MITRQWGGGYGDDQDYASPSPSREKLVEHHDHGTVVRTPFRPNQSQRLLSRRGPSKHRLARQALTAWYEVGQFFFTIGPRKALYYAARDYLRQHRVDAIIATGEPFVLFRYATRLSAEFGVPWIADYRDPWSHDRGASIKRISPWLEARLERKFTRSASALTTVCGFFRAMLASFHDSKRVHIVRNGYDPQAIASARGVEQGHDRLTIAFAGTVQAWDPIRSFFAACERVIRKDGAELELRFFLVNARQEVGAVLAEFPALARRARVLDRMPNDQVAVELSKSNALLVFNTYSHVGTKVYDYLALNRRILLCYSQDPETLRLKDSLYRYKAPAGDLNHSRPLERLIEETGSGVVVKDAAHLEGVLRDMLDEFDRKGSIACTASGTERFSRRTQAGHMALILEELTASCARS